MWVFFLEYWSITLSPEKISAYYRKNSDLWNFLNVEGYEPKFDVFKHIFKVQTVWNATYGVEIEHFKERDDVLWVLRKIFLFVISMRCLCL